MLKLSQLWPLGALGWFLRPFNTLPHHLGLGVFLRGPEGALPYFLALRDTAPALDSSIPPRGTVTYPSSHGQKNRLKVMQALAWGWQPPSELKSSLSLCASPGHSVPRNLNRRGTALLESRGMANDVSAYLSFLGPSACPTVPKALTLLATGCSMTLPTGCSNVPCIS